MGLHFGELAKVRGVIAYRLSPHELRPFAGVLNPGFANGVRRFRECFLTVASPLFVGYLVYAYAEHAHKQSLRKNPRDYADEVDPSTVEQ